MTALPSPLFSALSFRVHVLRSSPYGWVLWFLWRLAELSRVRKQPLEGERRGCGQEKPFTSEASAVACSSPGSILLVAFWREF